ncbi:MAG: hypothetical protein U0793_13345 [Gemmataceae bacterium]
MKRMMVILVIGVGLFGASAGVSLFMQKPETKDEHGEAEKEGKEGKGKAAKAEPKAPPLPARALAKPTAESLAQLATTLRIKEESLQIREQKMLTRQSQLETIFGDIKAEQKTLDALRAEIAEEMKALSEKMELLERRAGDVEKAKLKLSDDHKEVKRALLEVDSVEQKRVKQMADVYNVMEASAAGETFQHMVDTGKLDLAVKILAAMQERQVAKVLSEMPDRSTVVQMLEKLKGLKKATVSAP